MSLVIKEAKSVQAISELYNKHADVIVFSGSATPGFLNFDCNPCAGGFRRRKWVYHPGFHVSKRWESFKPLYDCVTGGLILVLPVKPSSASMSFVSEVLSAMDRHSLSRDGLRFLHEPENCYLYLQAGYCEPPLPVGIVDDAIGGRLPYTAKGPMVVWTRRWDPVDNMINPNLLRWLRKELEEDGETKDDYANFIEYSQRTNTDMFKSAVASDSFKDSSGNLILLDEARNWPVAFALKFGNGAVVILPENTDPENLVSEMEDCDSIKAGFELLKAYSNSLSEGIVVRLNGLPASKSGALKSSADVTYSVVIDGRAAIVTVKALCLFKFLVVWLASTSRLGVGIAFTTPNKLDEIKKTSGNGKLKIAMLAASETKLKPLPGGELFYQSTSNISNDITDNVNNAIYDRRDIDSKEWIKLYGRAKRKARTPVEKFSVRSVHGVRISASSKFISQLRRFRFDVSEDSKDARKDCKEFNDNAKEFIQLLISNIRSIR